jgi:succinate dehydrogenase/fumarate reductase flavoprotein subunit
VFLKGYQWPFDIRKVGDGSSHGSSIIDILVYHETAKGRRIFLDFRKNPLGRETLDFYSLSDEARSYLEAARACFGTPYERLVKMNSPAAEFYRGRGVDLSTQPLEIALCAQHNNGGLAVDSWWQSNIRGLFPVGEAAATHGVYRPGGSALNAGQAGSLRAAFFISKELISLPTESSDAACKQPDSAFLIEQIENIISLASSLLNDEDYANSTKAKGIHTAASLLAQIQKQMSLAGGPFRDTQKIDEALKDVHNLLEHFSKKASLSGIAELPLAFRLRDTLICQELYLSAMADFAAKSGRSRGSALYSSGAGSHLPGPSEIDDGSLNHRVQEIRLENGKPVISWRDVRPIPAADESFELVWSAFRKNLASFRN